MSDRRSVLHKLVVIKLAKHEPYVWGSADCSMAMWQLLNQVFPEYKSLRWFRRTTAETMAGWPWNPVLSLDDVLFGDLLFCGEPKIDHVMMMWDKTNSAVHAGKTKGFSETAIHPYWTPKITVIVRPPY